MKAILNWIRIAALFLVVSILVSCGGGRSSTPPTTAYYIDAASGSDSNSGLDPANPWKTLAQVSAAPVAANSTIYLKRGSVWNEQLMIPNSSITIDAYGSGALPTLDGSRVVGAWTDIGGGLYSASVALNAGEGLGNLSEDGVMMPFVQWSTDAATTFASAPNGTYSYSYPATLYIKRATAPSGVYRASVKFFGITATSLSDIIVKNIQTTRFSLHGISFKDCIRCEVHGAVVSQGGGATIAATLYAGNGIEFGNSSTNGIVDGTSVSEIFDNCISPQTYASGQTMSSITIKNSTIDKCGFAGVEVSVLSNGGSTGSSISGVTLSGLTITNAGKGWSGQRYGSEGNGIRIKADAGAGSMSNVQIDTTTIDGSVANGVVLAGETGTVNLHRMDIKNNIKGIVLMDATATSLKLHLTSSLIHDNSFLGIHYSSPTAAGFELYQNTFSNNAIYNLAVESQTNTARIQNNIFYASPTHIGTAVALAGAVIDNNCYGGASVMVSYNGTAYSTLALFTSAYPAFEPHGISGAVGLTNPAGDFSLLGSSDCKTSGSTSVGVTTDYSGYLFANPRSSGAYQYR